jgi:hypothetical protein
MKCLFQDEKLTFIFRDYYVTCYNYSYGYGYSRYQNNGILSFAIMDLAFKIAKQQKRKSITLKKRKPIIHLLNYIDILNFNLNSNKIDITFLSKNNYKISLLYNLLSYRRRVFKDSAYKDCLKVIKRKDSCVIRFEYDFATTVQPRNVNLAAMVMHVFEKEQSDKIDLSGIIFYCVLLM